MYLHKCEVLVIGSGAAGLRAATELHDKGLDVTVVGKCKRGDAHTVMATGGINAALGTMDPEDNWAIHAADTLKEGRFLANYRVVEALCKKAPSAIKELESYGVPFAKSNGKLIQRFFGAHTYRRTCFVGDETGKAILKALVNQAKKRKFPFLEDIYITSLLLKNGSVNGALGFDIKSSEIIVFSARCIVLATGGHSRLYKRSSSRQFENTGDGVALAYKIGAELQDMEMMQFHPTGMVWPKEAEGILVTEAVRGEGGFLLNSKNERFMLRYDKERMELGPRDEVARAIYNEIAAGRGTKHNGVWLDITHSPKSYIKKRLPKMYRQFQHYLGLDISKERMEVAPTAHYSMSGVRTNLDGSTNIAGLFAVGEVTGGVHGANRLGGNSLLETIVFGKIVGNAAANYAKKHALRPLDYNEIRKAKLKLNMFLGKKKGNPHKIKNELQAMMWQHVGIVRNESDLKTSLRELEKTRKMIKKTRTGNKINNDFIAAWDVYNLLIAAEAVIRSALLRKESKGAHYRSDYPKENNKWLVNIICKRKGNKMQLYRKKVAKPKGRVAFVLKKNLKPKVRVLHEEIIEGFEGKT